MFQKPSPDIALAKDAEREHMQDDSVETVVGPSMNVEGDFVSEGNIIVKGFVSGSIKTGKTVFIEQGARVIANIKAGDAMIAGDVRGNIRVGGKLEIESSAQILGDIHCKNLKIDSGALIQGKVAMAGLEIEDPTAGKKRTGVRTKTKSVESTDTDE